MTWARLAGEGDVAPGCAAAFELENGDRVALCNVDGEFYAIDDICTHDGGPLDQGELIGKQIECPRHGARFDVTTGRALTLPAVRPVRSFPTRVIDGTVEVEVP